MRPAPPKWPLHFSHPSVEAVGRKLKRIFDQNASTEYFSREEIRDYRTTRIFLSRDSKE